MANIDVIKQEVSKLRRFINPSQDYAGVLNRHEVDVIQALEDSALRDEVLSLVFDAPHFESTHNTQEMLNQLNLTVLAALLKSIIKMPRMDFKRVIALRVACLNHDTDNSPAALDAKLKLFVLDDILAARGFNRHSNKSPNFQQQLFAEEGNQPDNVDRNRNILEELDNLLPKNNREAARADILSKYQSENRPIDIRLYIQQAKSARQFGELIYQICDESFFQNHCDYEHRASSTSKLTPIEYFSTLLEAYQHSPRMNKERATQQFMSLVLPKMATLMPQESAKLIDIIIESPGSLDAIKRHSMINQVLAKTTFPQAINPKTPENELSALSHLIYTLGYSAHIDLKNLDKSNDILLLLHSIEPQNINDKNFKFYMRLAQVYRRVYAEPGEQNAHLAAVEKALEPFLIKQRCDTNNINESRVLESIKKQLEERFPSINFALEANKTVFCYELDFYFEIDGQKYNIEIDGSHHNAQDKQEKDEIRKKVLHDHAGIQVRRFPAHPAGPNMLAEHVFSCILQIKREQAKTTSEPFLLSQPSSSPKPNNSPHPSSSSKLQTK